MWTISQAADRAGLTSKAVRVYESRGLLPTPARSPAGYRLYDDLAVDLLRFIRQARDAGLSLTDIAQVLQAGEQPGGPCATVQELARVQITHIDARIVELAAVRARLVDLIEGSPHPPRPGCRCPLIETGGGPLSPDPQR
jgi:MerR family copper efflux transcriptional regulator